MEMLSSPSPEEVSTVCRILRQRDWHRDFGVALKESGVAFRPSLITEVLRLQRDARRALRFYVWASRQKGYRHDSHTNCAILRFWGHEKLCKAFLVILHNLGRPNFVLSPPSLTVLIKGYGWAGMVDEAVEAVIGYDTSGSHVECQHFNCLFTVLIREKRFETFESLSTEMERMGLTPTVVTHSLRALALCKQGRVDDAIDALRKKVFPPSVVLFNTVLDGLCKVGRSENAFRMLSEMEKQGCHPDLISYNTVIYGLCKSSRFTDVYALFDEMSIKGFIPTARTYATLIYGLCNAKEFTQANNVFNSLGERVSPPNTVMYNVLIQGLCEDGFLGDASKLLERMVVEGVVRDAATYKPFISYWCKRKEIDKALGVLNELKQCSIPSVKCYMEIIFELCEAGRLDAAECIFEEMLATGWEPNESIFHAICVGLLKAGRLERLHKFQEDMTRRGYNLPIEPRI